MKRRHLVLLAAVAVLLTLAAIAVYLRYGLENLE